MKKKHGLAWWLCIGWWWYLVFAWWVYPIKWLLSRKSPKAAAVSDVDQWYPLVHETEEFIISFLKDTDGGAALQVDVKSGLPHELYEDGKIKTSKAGSRVRLELV